MRVESKNGDMEIAKLLVENGADVNARSTEFGQAPIVLAMQFGYQDIAMYLLDNGTSIDGCDVLGISHLNWAISANDLAICRELINCGADVNIQDVNGFTALFEAAKSSINAKEKIDLLINAGADIHIKNNSGETALDIITVPIFEDDPVYMENARILRQYMK